MDEAYRLLKKCIIHVRTEDVSLEDEEDEEGLLHGAANLDLGGEEEADNG